MEPSIATLNAKLISTRWRDEFERKWGHHHPRHLDYADRLVESMKTHGFLLSQRIVVYDDTSTIDLYQLLLGLGRFRAAMTAGITQIPVIILHGTLTDKQLMQFYYDPVEPLRLGLAEIAEFKSVMELIATMRYSRVQIADRIGISVTRAVTYQKLSTLPDEVIQLWISQQRGGKKKPFRVTNRAIDKLYAAMHRDRRGTTLDQNGIEVDSGLPPNYDPNGGLEYKDMFSGLSQ